MNIPAVIDHMVKELLSYCESAGLNGFVVGVSGGIDSAVTSTLCAKTGKKVVLLGMPILQDPGQESLSDRHMDWLSGKFPQTSSTKIDLTTSFTTFQQSMPEPVKNDALAMANARSRLRMVTLYAFAGHYKLLVTGTGNKVEDFGVGFFTKYGDGGVDIAPIANLMKSEVYAIAKELDILQEIQQTAPTDGLWADNRTDESQIGATYDELEWALRAVGKKLEGEKMSARQKEVLALFKRLHAANRHKMVPIPVIKIPKSLK